MMPPRTPRASNGDSAANLGFEADLWAAADLLRGNIESSEYKHVILGLIFLEYVSDAFEERHAELVAEAATDPGVDPEDPDEYVSRGIYWLPPAARWPHLRDNARSPEIGKLIDEAMKAIEDSDRSGKLKGVLPRDYSRPALDKARLGQLIDRFSGVGGGTEHQSRDTLGRVYEYFLNRFASAEGRRGGEYFTPRCVVGLLVEMLQPRENTRIYDPCCGSGGMFIQSEKFIEAHGGRRKHAISVFGQERNHTTWRLCKMNLAIRGIEADVREGDSFSNDRHPDLKADFVLANPPFNMSEWGGDKLRNDGRWQYGTPPAGNANYAWIQHFVHHLKPDGFAGFVMANGSLSSNSSGEGEIRKSMVEADLVDCRRAASTGRTASRSAGPASASAASGGDRIVSSRRPSGRRTRHSKPPLHPAASRRPAHEHVCPVERPAP
jgi:type I restriction enzyme M protein